MPATSSGLMQLIEVIVGFSTIMLLFSLLVSSLIQFVSSVLKLRAKALVPALQAILNQDAIKGAIGLTAEQFLAKIPTTKNPYLSWLNAKEPTWITKEEFLQIFSGEFGSKLSGLQKQRDQITATGNALDGEAEQRLAEISSDIRGLEQGFEAAAATAETWFSRMESEAEDFFRTTVRAWTFAIALIVALLFRVDTFTILERLNTDPAFRSSLVSAAEDLSGQEDTLFAEEIPLDFSAPLQKTQEVVFKEFKELPDLTAFAADAVTADEVMAAIDANMKESNPEQWKAVRDEFEQQLTSIQVDEINKRMESISGLVEQLSAFDFKLSMNWRTFYCEDPNRLLGVFLSAIFLSLGAPFWFRIMKGALNFRDSLRKTEKEKAQEN